MAGFIRKVAKHLFHIILFILTIIIFPPVFCLVGLPSYVIRRLVSISSRFFRPDLGKMLSTRSAVFATDDIYRNPKATLLVFLVAEMGVEVFDKEYGQAFLKAQQRDLASRLINLRTPDGKLVHPELQQYISSWMGFYFWKFDKDFKIENHMDIPDVDYVLDEDKIVEISKELARKPFVKGRSPWEFVGFNSVKLKGKHTETGRPQGAVAFRLHHSLADGYSILKLLADDIAKTKVEIIKPSLIQRSCLSRAFSKTTFCLRAPYEFLSQLADAYDINDWHVSEAKISPNINFCFTDKIPLSYIKEIKARNNVTFTAVIFAVFAGALRNFMLERGVVVPEAVHCVAPFPVPGHPTKLRNYMTAIFVRLPVGLKNADERIHTIHKHLKSLKKSTVPYTQFLLFPLMGGLFPCMTRHFFKQYYSTAILSFFPGPPNKIEYEGHKIEDIFFNGGMLPGRIGISLTSVSYGEYLRIGAGFNEGVLPANVSLEQFKEKIMEELKLLYENETPV